MGILEMFSLEGWFLSDRQSMGNIIPKEIIRLRDEIGNISPEIASYFLKSSMELLNFMTIREIAEWANPAISIAKRSKEIARYYLSSIPIGLNSLYGSERRKIFKLTSFLANSLLDSAVDFYMKLPDLILNLNPSVREMVLDEAMEISCDTPKEIIKILEDIVCALKPLSWPDQKLVMEQTRDIRNISKKAALKFLENVKDLLPEIKGQFLIKWAQKGVSILRNDEGLGIHYFSLKSGESIEEISRWKEAILLDDYLNLFSFFAIALSGKKISIKSTENIDSCHYSLSRNYPTTDGETIFLPPYMKDGITREENFRQYKVATAHQSGYIEFGTFDETFPLIKEIINSLPCKELAWDILFILEDGRIDRRLKDEYAGLSHEIDLALSTAINKRPLPRDLPFKEAIVEALLRLTAGNLRPSEISYEISGPVEFIKSSIDGFYENAKGIWDCFIKTMEIYNYILKNSPEIRSPFDEWKQKCSGRESQIPYLPSSPIQFRGRIEPELIQIPFKWKIISREMEEVEGTAPISMDELKRIIDTLKDPSIWKLMDGSDIESQGLFITGIEELIAKFKSTSSEREKGEKFDSIPFIRSNKSKGPFYYDEWDYIQKSYRKRWCCVRERSVDPQESEFVDDVYRNYNDLIKKVKMEFNRIRPDYFQPLRRVEWGDEIYLPAAIERAVDIKTGQSPSDMIFSRREKRLRRISTLLLIDMSASTDEIVPLKDPSDLYCDENGSKSNNQLKDKRRKKIIDIEKESLVVMMEAFESLNDEYGIFGFSGHGRENVDFYLIKEFSDPYSEEMKMRIGGIQPKQSTRMGAAIRHAISKFRSIESDQRILILLSDGFPQDHDYGEDRRSKEYALHDTMMALIEARKEGIRPFCITVDQAGNDYLRKMCEPESYLVIQDIYSLPERLPRIVEALMA